jgi:hypothetical protein
MEKCLSKKTYYCNMKMIYEVSSALVLLATIFIITIFVLVTWHLTSVFAISVSDTPPTTNSADPALNFSIRYNSTVIDPQALDPFKMMLWIEAPPEVMQQIKNVTYMPSKFGGARFPVYSSENKFAQTLYVAAGPKVNTTVYFKDNGFIQHPTIQTSVEIPDPDISPVDLQIDARIIDSNLTINGKAIPKENFTITNITVDWGDGNITEPKNNLSFSHLYSKPVPPVVDIIVGIKRTDIPNSIETFLIHHLATSNLIIKENIPKDDSTLIFSRSGEDFLTIDTNLGSMQADTPVKFNVSGKLVMTSNSTGPGVSTQPILIDFHWMEHPERYERMENVTTKENGYYTLQDELTLEEGNYKISARPNNYKFIGASPATKDLVVYGKSLTSEQLTTYLIAGIGTGLAVLGAILRVPGYFTSVKQANTLSRYLAKINDKYYQFSNEKSIGKDEFVRELYEIRRSVTYLLERRDINENQYKILDDKITYYIDNLAE